MGCDEVRTLELDEKEDPQNDQFGSKKNVCLKKYTGQLDLQSDNNFKDSIISNMEELEDKLRQYIPTKIKKDDSDVPTFNVGDDILTKSVAIDFSKCYLLAIHGVNQVLRVEEENGNYLIYHDNQPASKNKYFALIVKQIGINPNIFYATPKQMI